MRATPLLDEKVKGLHLTGIQRLNLRRLVNLYTERIVVSNLDQITDRCRSQLRSTNLRREDFLKPNFCPMLKLTPEKTPFQPSAQRVTRSDISRARNSVQYARTIGDNLQRFLDSERQRQIGLAARIARGEVSQDEMAGYVFHSLERGLTQIIATCGESPIMCAVAVYQAITKGAPKALQVLTQYGPKLVGGIMSLGAQAPFTMSAGLAVGVYALLHKLYPKQLPAVSLFRSAVNSGQDLATYLSQNTTATEPEPLIKTPQDAAAIRAAQARADERMNKSAPESVDEPSRPPSFGEFVTETAFPQYGREMRSKREEENLARLKKLQQRQEEDGQPFKIMKDGEDVVFT